MDFVGWLREFSFISEHCFWNF